MGTVLRFCCARTNLQRIKVNLIRSFLPPLSGCDDVEVVEAADDDDDDDDEDEDDRLFAGVIIDALVRVTSATTKQV